MLFRSLLGALGDIAAQGSVIAEDQQHQTQPGEQADAGEQGDEQHHDGGDGSVFKLVTCLSALENFSDFSERKYTCQRGVTLSNEWLSCLSNHGTLGIKDGLAQSCNAVFSQVALDVGKTALTNTANEIGFNKTLYMDGIKCAESKFDVSSAPDIDLGWAGIGQYNEIGRAHV